MGAITEQMLQNPRAVDIAKKAETWFGRSSGQAKYIDVPLKATTGDWWAKAYEKISPLLTDDERKTGDRCRDMLKPWLNDWSKDPKNRPVEQTDGIVARFNELLTKLNITDVGLRKGAKQADIDDFRNRGFSAMMAVSAGWCAKPDKDFEITLEKTKVATLCDSVYERWGDPPQEFRIGTEESPSDYWVAKGVVAGDVPKARDQITEDLSTVTDSKASADKIKDAYDRLSENLLQVTDATKAEYGPASGMLFVEAVRSPLGCLRPGPDQPKGQGSSESLSGDDIVKLNTQCAGHLEEIRRRGDEESKLPER